jgi:ADP-ribose pyrophosphatase
MERIIAYEGKTLQVIQVGNKECIERKDVDGIAVIIAVTEDKKLILVEQFRAALDRRVVELPAGKIGDDHKGESMQDGAQRELLEETGYKAETLEIVASGSISPGILGEVVTFIYAKNIVKEQHGGGVDDEDIITYAVPLVDLDEFLDGCRNQGLLIDMKIFAGRYFLSELL